MSKELLLTPVTIARSKEEKVMVEGSINSVRISILFAKQDETEKILAKRYMAFLAQRADNFVILRRKPIQVRFSYLIQKPGCTNALCWLF